MDFNFKILSFKDKKIKYKDNTIVSKNDTQEQYVIVYDKKFWTRDNGKKLNIFKK